VVVSFQQSSTVTGQDISSHGGSPRTPVFAPCFFSFFRLVGGGGAASPPKFHFGGLLKAKIFTIWIFSNLGKTIGGENITQTPWNKQNTTGKEVHNSLTNQRKIISQAENDHQLSISATTEQHTYQLHCDHCIPCTAPCSYSAPPCPRLSDHPAEWGLRVVKS
jgi:hypothetical protein